MNFDPITLEILWRRLLSIVDEADAAVARAFSSLLGDAHDYTCMFTDTRKQPRGTPELVLRDALTIADGTVTADLTGSSAQVDRGGNVVYNFTYAYVHMAVKSIVDPEIPNNDGVAAPIRLIAPAGSVVNCRPPVAVAARMQIGHFITELVYRALAAALARDLREGKVSDAGVQRDYDLPMSCAIATID
jgi:N-methylhydantoinase B